MREFLRERTGLALIVASAVLVFGLLVAGIGQVVFREDTQSQEEVATQHREEIASAQIAACEDDHEFRLQYRIRAVAEQKLLTLFLGLAKQNIAAGTGDAQTSRDFIKEFTPLTERIEILPVPDCQALREELAP